MFSIIFIDFVFIHRVVAFDIQFLKVPDAALIKFKKNGPFQHLLYKFHQYGNFPQGIVQSRLKIITYRLTFGGAYGE